MTAPAPSTAGGTGASPTVGPTAAGPLLDAAAEALAAEYRAGWGYPVLGPRLSAPDQVAFARACDDAHAVAAQSLQLLLVGLGRPPAAPLADYPLPTTLSTPAQAAAFAVTLEQTVAAAWRFVVVQTGEGTDVAGLKATAVDALTAAAVRATQWRVPATPDAATVAFPGT